MRPESLDLDWSWAVGKPFRPANENLAADLSHLFSIFILLQKIISSKVSDHCPDSTNSLLTLILRQSCSGISFKSQALYLAVYATRYIGGIDIGFASRNSS